MTRAGCPPQQELLDRIVSRITAVASPTRVVLFGSTARGDTGQDSDLDLMVVEQMVVSRRDEMVRLRRSFAAHEGRTIYAR